MREKSEKSENRKALPKFLFTLLIAGLVGGVIGFTVGLSDVFGWDTDAIAAGIRRMIQAATPWAIPVTTLVTMGGSFLLYRSARKKYAAWSGGDEDTVSKAVDMQLNWILLLGAVQLLISLFFFAAAAAYDFPGTIYSVVAFLISIGLVLYAQQKVVDLTRLMNPEKKASVYDQRFQKKWLESCDEAERQQIGRAAFHAYSLTSKVCLWMWVVLMVCNLIFGFGLVPAFAVLLIMGVLQVSYILECIRMSKNAGGPMWRC